MIAPAVAFLPDAARPLERAQAEAAFEAIVAGEADPDDIGRFLVQLADRGESVEEVVGAATVLRSRMKRVAAPEDAIDVCGTGGDGLATLNISTAVALVVAACGVPVAKHGNRAASSQSGGADVLAALGLDLELPVDRVEKSLSDLRLGFLFAANHHAAMAQVAPVRRALGRRTIFNLLGPLINPAGVKRQLVGVFSDIWVERLAQALRALGTVSALVVHGGDGVDELSISKPSLVARLDQQNIGMMTITPELAGLPRHPTKALRGGTPVENAQALRALLAGTPGAYRDAVLLNSAGALIVAGRAAHWREGVTVAADAIDSGASARLLERWTSFR